MKGIFPYERQEITIDIRKMELITELKKEIQLTGYIPIIKDKKLKQFYGNTSSSTWKIVLKTNYINTLKPVVYLTMIEEQNKTRIIIEFKTSLIMRVFAILFWSLSLMILVGNVISTKDQESYYFPVGFIIIVFIMLYMGFFLTLEKIMQTLEKILEKIKTTANSK